MEDLLEDFLLALEVEDQQIITKVLLEDLQEALDHQDKVEEVLTIVSMEVQVEARDLVRIVSKEVWEEQQEATATKEALVDIMEEMDSQDKVEDQDQVLVVDLIIKEEIMEETLEDMEEIVLLEDLVLLALCLDPVSMDYKEEIITREGFLVGTREEAATIQDQDQQLEMVDLDLGLEVEAIIKPALGDHLDKQVDIMEVKQEDRQEEATLVEVLSLMVVMVGLDMEL